MQMNTTTMQLNCVKTLKVLADETRLAVLELLMDEGPKYVGEINAILNLEQSLLSHHLQVLRQAELVVSQRDGKVIIYSLAPKVEVTTNKALNLGCCVLSFT
jgi:DNA-binding transcriptional ArsR family regulator